ncbi:MAG: flagellar export chaperone FliS [Leptothrix sp. (in: Bacteria)]|nr:flagellar export chaperone FliS [Leptothrix sp. (in: b-proteobacteria)]
MFAASLFTPRRAAPNRAAAYQSTALEIQVAGADAHRLVALLFEGFEQAAAEAQGALANGDTELKCRALTRAIRIVDEGLRSHLNVDAGGILARDLLDLYGYVVQRLTLANARNDAELIAECLRLMQPLHEAWLAIGRRAPSAR